ncbi:hypothetical protein GGS23DRAFT_556234 [Durotheca rogersii]|uniref:uncharacterized protein n=1 Tax=Durotheca rogersii TaxID=419775 RepID=UPI00221FBDD6|nr:uncharacterized protein GGS23DRAFT_556234 [Durotheca rogersii]KAI5866257.1 hypothetical protein GGS23DRAFT_556234 [Durotheca rogersii]
MPLLHSAISISAIPLRCAMLLGRSKHTCILPAYMPGVMTSLDLGRVSLLICRYLQPNTYTTTNLISTFVASSYLTYTYTNLAPITDGLCMS